MKTDTAMTAKQVSGLLSPSEKVLEVLDALASLNPEATLAEGLEAALIGHSVSGEECVAVYDMDKCVKILMKTHDMDEEEAEDFFSYNVLRGLAYSGESENAPIFVKLPN
jgi:hypothetical protein